MIFAFAAVPAAMYFFTVIATKPHGSKEAIIAGLKHFSVPIALAIFSGVLLALFFQCS